MSFALHWCGKPLHLLSEQNNTAVHVVKVAYLLSLVKYGNKIFENSFVIKGVQFTTFELIQH